MILFRLLGDMSHVYAIIFLWRKVLNAGSCEGISGKSQFLFAIVFTTRYLDLFLTFISLYNVVMKIFFLVTSYGMLYLIYIKFKKTYDSDNDTFRIELLILPAMTVALLINDESDPIEILWTFSIYLESVTILPQLFMTSKTREADSFISHYLIALGSYRAFYLLNWAFRYIVYGKYNLIAIFGGIVWLIPFLSFFLCPPVFPSHSQSEKKSSTMSKIDTGEPCIKPLIPSVSAVIDMPRRTGENYPAKVHMQNCNMGNSFTQEKSVT